jgi:hypothetical protein
MSPIFSAIQTSQVTAWRNGAPDANDQAPERQISKGAGNPCRHCLQDIPNGALMLVLGHRPFPTLQPYAECGPIFVCAEPCDRSPDSVAPPRILTTSPDYLIKGYSADHRIVYGTGAIVPKADLVPNAIHIFDNVQVAYIHVRSARNNCYQVRIDRDSLAIG